MVTKLKIVAASALALGLTVGSAQAVTITYSAGLFSPFEGLPGFTTNNFNTGATPRTTEPGYAGAFTIYPSPSGTVQSAAPAGDATPFFSVPNPSSTGYATLTLGGDANYFGLYWGSIDQYNTIAFYNDGSLVGSFTGGDLPSPAAANGNQSALNSNLYVNFDFGSDVYDSVRFTSTNFAFESDNHTYGQVPEPATLALLGAGLLGLGMIRRRKSA